MNQIQTWKIAKNIAEKTGLTKAISYDLFYRDYDNQIELIGLIDDPNYDMNDFSGREMLFPKKWVTLTVLDPSYEVTIND
jgi:5'(3')-deoxyribonucleotidase